MTSSEPSNVAERRNLDANDDSAEDSNGDLNSSHDSLSDQDDGLDGDNTDLIAAYDSTLAHLDQHLDALVDDKEKTKFQSEDLKLTIDWLENAAASIASWSLDIKLKAPHFRQSVDVVLQTAAVTAFVDIEAASDDIVHTLREDGRFEPLKAMGQAIQALQTLTRTIQMQMAKRQQSGPLQSLNLLIEDLAQREDLALQKQPAEPRRAVRGGMKSLIGWPFHRRQSRKAMDQAANKMSASHEGPLEMREPAQQITGRSFRKPMEQPATEMLANHERSLDLRNLAQRITRTCPRCDSPCISTMTRLANRNENSGRPFIKCTNPKCGKFVCWADDMETYDGNPLCSCGNPSRLTENDTDERLEVYYECATKFCDFRQSRIDKTSIPASPSGDLTDEPGSSSSVVPENISNPSIDAWLRSQGYLAERGSMMPSRQRLTPPRDQLTPSETDTDISISYD